MSTSDGDRALVLDVELLRNLADAITILTPDGDIVSTTAGQSPALGHSLDDWAAQAFTDLIHPDDVELAREKLTTARDHPGVPVEGEVRLRHAVGHHEIVQFRAIGEAGGNGATGRILVTSRVVTTERHRDQIRQRETEVLELIGEGGSLATVFYALARLVEEHSDDGLTVVLLLDENDVLRAGAAPRIPRDLFDLIDGLRVDADTGSFGRAVRDRTETAVIDLTSPEPATPLASNPGPGGPGTDTPAGGDLPDLAGVFEQCGLRGYWSVPITYASREHGLGSIVTFYPHDRGPAPYEREAVLAAARLAGIAIERDRLEAQIRHQAEHDLLTGLPNRATVTERLSRLLSRPHPTDRIVAVMFLDVDAFKLINDSHGHSVGDSLLARFARRIAKLLPDVTTLARFGGDEFVIVVDHPDGAEQARVLADRIDEALRQPFRVGDNDLFLTVSVGVATPGPGTQDADAVLGNADAAMHQAKQSGRGGFVLFEESMRTLVVDRLRSESRLRRAIDRHEFTLRYQPKVDLTTGVVMGAEALLRWEHPTDGLVGPDEVIPWAESTGLIVPLGAWVLETAVEQARLWMDSTPGDPRFLLAVNVSGRQLGSPGFPQLVADVLERHGWPASSLCLEMTESILIRDTEANLDALRRIKDLGVLLAVDDFGTGYSSLSYLHRFPIDIVKVDKGFVADLAHPAARSPVAAAVVAMAEAFGLTASAEGVETPLQLDAVRRMGCEWGQGFLWAPALPPGELRALLGPEPPW